MQWSEIRKVHSDVVSSVVSAAEGIAPDRWDVARAEGKWSPAEVVEHLILTYDTMTGEAGGAPGMRLRTKWWPRLLWRFTILPRLLRGAPFPPGVPAPRELRPTVTRGRSEAIAAFRDRAAKFDAAIASGLGTPKKLTHAYLGKLSLPDAMLFCARHMQHHEKQLRAIGS